MGAIITHHASDVKRPRSWVQRAWQGGGQTALETSHREKGGLTRVSESVFDRLWTAALSLAEIEEASLPAFPVLGDSARRRVSPR
jgi:hypothetical protein